MCFCGSSQECLRKRSLQYAMGQQKIGSNLAISSPERLPERLQGCPVLQTFPTFNAQTCSNLWPLKIDWVYKCIYIYTKVQWPLQFHSLSLEFLLNFTSFSAIAPFRLCTRHTLPLSHEPCSCSAAMAELPINPAILATVSSLPIVYGVVEQDMSKQTVLSRDLPNLRN